jgi:hypothetical protein
MAGRLPFIPSFVTAPGMPAATLLGVLLLALGHAQAADDAPTFSTVEAAAEFTAATNAAAQAREVPDVEDVADSHRHYGPPIETPGIPSDAVLEKEGAVIGEVLVDNQNIFNLQDPKDDNKIFRLADRLHIKTRARVVREQLLFKPGDHGPRA